MAEVFTFPTAGGPEKIKAHTNHNSNDSMSIDYPSHITLYYSTEFFTPFASQSTMTHSVNLPSPSILSAPPPIEL